MQRPSKRPSPTLWATTGEERRVWAPYRCRRGGQTGSQSPVSVGSVVKRCPFSDRRSERGRAVGTRALGSSKPARLYPSLSSDPGSWTTPPRDRCSAVTACEKMATGRRGDALRRARRAGGGWRSTLPRTFTTTWRASTISSSVTGTARSEGRGRPWTCCSAGSWGREASPCWTARAASVPRP
jgi:hypothetical protein